MCPACTLILHAAAKQCQKCGYNFPQKAPQEAEKEAPHGAHASQLNILSEPLLASVKHLGRNQEKVLRFLLNKCRESESKEGVSLFSAVEAHEELGLSHAQAKQAVLSLRDKDILPRIHPFAGANYVALRNDERALLLGSTFLLLSESFRFTLLYMAVKAKAEYDKRNNFKPMQFYADKPRELLAFYFTFTEILDILKSIAKQDPKAWGGPLCKFYENIAEIENKSIRELIQRGFIQDQGGYKFRNSHLSKADFDKINYLCIYKPLVKEALAWGVQEGWLPNEDEELISDYNTPPSHDEAPLLEENHLDMCIGLSILSIIRQAYTHRRLA